MVDFNYLQKEYIKCFKDKSRIYMIQNYLRTFDGTQGKEVPFNLFPRQQLLCQTLGYGDASVCTTKYRQAGITTVTAGFISCQTILSDKNSPITVLIIGNTLDLAQQMLGKIKYFLLQFPLWMWGDEFLDKGYDITKPPSNTNIIFEKCNGKELFTKNGCKIYARSSGPNASRGISACHYLIFDETAFIENGKEVYASALPTISSVHGKVVFVSTPNGKDQLYYETCRRAKLKGTPQWNNFELVEMKWYQDPRYNKFLEWTKKNEDSGEVEVYKEPLLDKSGSVKYDNEHWEQMIKDGWKPRSPWYTTMCQQFNNDEQKIAQELDVSFLGSASNVVPPEAIEMQANLNVREPLPKSEDGDMFHLEDTWIWKKPIKGHTYIMQIDCSRGDSADRSALEIVDVDGEDENGVPCFEQVLEYNGKITGDDLGEIAYWYGMLYNEAFCVVEAIGGYGDATILTLQRLGYTNMYFDDPNLKTYTVQRDASSLQLTNDGKLPGFHSSSVRFQMLSHFANMVRVNEIKIRSKRVISELDTWIYKNGRHDHQDGCHDDTLTCLAMGMFVFKYHLTDMQKIKDRDASFLTAFINSAKRIENKYGGSNKPKEITSKPTKSYVPVYTSKTVNRVGNTIIEAYKWLLA